MQPTGSVTSLDVARDAGVSRATVSYVLNGVEQQRISEETKARVLAAAKRLGYAPNAAARALRDGRTDLVLIGNPPWALGPLVAGGLTAAVERLTEYGMTPVLAIGPAATGEHFVRACQRIRPRGVIAPTDELTTSTLRSLRAVGVSAIVAMGDRVKKGVPTGLFEQHTVGRMAVEYLATAGHRRIVGVGPLAPSPERSIADQRLSGAARAATSGGLAFTEVRIAGPADLPDALRRCLESDDPPTAVFAYNDEYAMAAIHALHAAGLDVPGDIAVMGCDDIPAAEYFTPALTTLAPDAVRSYRAVADTLIRLMNGDEPDTLRISSPVQLRRRRSA